MRRRRAAVTFSLLVALQAAPWAAAAQEAPAPTPEAAAVEPAAAAAVTPSAPSSAAPVAAIVALTTPTREAPFERNLPPRLRRGAPLDLRLWQWFALPILLVVAIVLATLATFATRGLLRPAVVRTQTTSDDELLRRARGPLLIVFTIAFFAAGLPVLALPEPVHAFARGLLKGLGVVTLSWAALRLLDLFSLKLAHRLERQERRRLAALIPLGRRASKVFLALIAVVVLLQNVGLDVTGLIAGLGVGGIAVALAAQKTIENVFGGVSVIADQPVRVGDLCRFRDGAIGTIEEIGLRSTRIRTPERTLVTIPNADFAQRELENLTARDRIRIYTVLGLRYETTTEQLGRVLEALRQLFGSHPLVSAETLRIFFIGFGASSLDVEISAYVHTTDPDEFSAVREDLLLRTIDAIGGCGTALARPVTVAAVASTLAAAPAPATKK